MTAHTHEGFSLTDLHTTTDPDATALPAERRIADTVAAHLEPVTRFDRADIGQDGPDQALSAALTLTLVQHVNFDVEWHAGARHLPKDITLASNGFALKVTLNEQLGMARAGCDDALRAWVAHAPKAYRRIVPPAAAFRRTPGRYGIEFTCQRCFGKCQLECAGCSGAGKISCYNCHGAGTTRCDQCNGSARMRCNSCLGHGQTTEQVSEQRWDAAANAYVTIYVPVNRSCHACNGIGTTECRGCKMGQAECRTCSGRRTLTCKQCQGAGCFDCGACEATGVQHEWASVTAAVTAHEELTFGPLDSTLQTLIGERIAPADLPAYGSHLATHHSIEGASLGSRYELRIDALHARLHAAARHFSVYGLGPKAQVLDFVNIAGHLLEDDLVTLEQAAAPLAPWARPKDAVLLGALKLFVASELNLLIAEQLGEQKAASAVESHFHNMVDAAYVQRATAALRLGFNGLYGADLLRPALWVAGGAAAAAALVIGFGPAHYGVWQGAAWATLAGALAWAGVEMLSLHRIMRSFPEQIGARLHAQIKAGGSVNKWRLAVGAAVIACAFVGAKLVSVLPFVEARHQGLSAVADAAPDMPPYSIERDRSTADKEGLYEIREEARKFITAHNKKHKTSFRALEPNLKAMYPKCSTRMTVSWVPKSYGLSARSVFVSCKKSVSKHARKWEAIVPVAGERD
jgi:hypothetical protein